MFDADFEARGRAYVAAQHPQIVVSERAAQLDELAERYDELVRMDDAEAFVIGVVHRYGAEPHLAYDLHAVLLDLQRQGMTAEEAEEF